MENKIYLNLNIPLYFNIIGIKSNNFQQLYLYNNYYFFKLTVNKNEILLNKNTNAIKIKSLNLKKYLIKNNLIIFLKSIDSYFFLKIKFKGKGYKINFYKKIKLMKFFFGASHTQIMFIKKIILKKLSKYKFILKSVNPINLKQVGKKIIFIRKINPYTLRGIRLSKSILIKRKGRKGAWV
jgi:ribosomal protein L6P/L9E